MKNANHCLTGYDDEKMNENLKKKRHPFVPLRRNGDKKNQVK